MEPHVSHYLEARFDVFDFSLPALFRRRGEGPSTRLGGWHPLARLRAWQDKRRALRDLARLDDHLLADIGLSRAEIRPVVEGLVSAKAANDNRAQEAA